MGINYGIARSKPKEQTIMARLKLVSLSRRPVSPAQQTQRELAWILRITCGYQANVSNALAFNAYTLDHRHLALVQRIQNQVAHLEEELRRELGSIQ